ncbi:hypothetical protein BGZ83_004035 [Gryganskiella cystojenkinii]|nr:hypothetical protein BGZ83_004035 [Gryganskiella cystojenkinii]
MSTRFARTADKSSNDKHTRILKALLQKPGNKFCVDCRKKGARLFLPLRCVILDGPGSYLGSSLYTLHKGNSFNLGCFMCIRCSGVHRSMGTHISKVKSVDLDSWTVDQVENMIKWGNEKANLYWEARLPEASIPNESTSGIDPWIRSKYEHKQFARKGPFPDPSELGPIDEAMLMDLYGKVESHSRPTAQMSRSTGESSGSFTGMIAPPPSNPTRSSASASAFPKRPTSSGVQGADLFSIGQPPSAKAAPAQEDFFGFNDPAPAPAAQKPTSKPAPTTASQDLFAMTNPAASTPANGQAQSPAKPAGNTDWKSSILSLYGNQSSAPRSNPIQNGFNMGQQQQQQHQQQPSAQFGQLQGMSAFGFGQAPQQPQQQQQQQQQNPWGADDGFGAMQSGNNSSFDAFSMGSNNNANNGFGASNNNNRPANGNGMPQGGDFFNMIASASRSPTSPPQSTNKNNGAGNRTPEVPLSSLRIKHDDPVSNSSTPTRKTPAALGNLPLECIQAILEHLSDDCHALYSLLVMNRVWFQLVIPFLYRSPMILIDATWPKLSPYSQVLKKELPQQQQGEVENTTAASSTTTGLGNQQPQQPQQRNGRSSTTTQSDSNSCRRTSTASITSPIGGGIGYSPRNHSRSSSRSSTRSMEAFHQGKNEAVLQKDQRERLIKRKKMQVLWVLLNCTLSEEERSELAQLQAGAEAEAEAEAETATNGGASQGHNDELEQQQAQQSLPPPRNTSRVRAKLPIQGSKSTLLSLTLATGLDVELDYFRPMVDYLSYHTHYYHPGLRFLIWKLFPDIEDSYTIEWRLISHCPERIRELFLETVQMQDLLPLVSRLSTCHRIRSCHESWDVEGSVRFIQEHNALFGTVRMLELEAYLPENHDTVMEPDLSRLIAQVEHLSVLELAGFTHLETDLQPIPRRHLKVLKLNCGSLNPESDDQHQVLPGQAPGPGHGAGQPQQQQNPEGAGGDVQGTDQLSTRMDLQTFLSLCRDLEELHLKSVDENLLEWAVQERIGFESGSLIVPPPVPLSLPLAHEITPALVPLRIIELSGTDSEHIAMTISHAAFAFQDTLEVIKANSYSYLSNKSLTSLSWSVPMPRLRVLKIVGRANLPFDFRSLQHCPALKSLDLSKYSGIRSCSESLLLNLKYLTQLEYLGLSSLDHLTDSTLRTILGCMPGLKHLRLAIGDTPVPTSSYVVSGVAGGPSRGGSGSGTASSFGASLGGHGSGSGSSGESLQRPSSSQFQALSGSSTAAGSVITSAPVVSPPLPPGMTHMIVGQIQQPSFHGHAHPHYSYHYPPQSPMAAAASSSSATSSTGAGSGTGVGPAAVSSAPFASFPSGTTTLDLQDFVPQPSPRFSARSSSVSSTSSLSTSVSAVPGGPSSLSTSYFLPMMDRFHLENNYLSLEGILDAIDGFSDTKNQLQKLTIVLGKTDFEDHYYRLEHYSRQHQELEITVYRYAHAV